MICFILSLTLFYLFLLMFVMRWTKFMKSCCFVFSMRKTDACKCMHNFVNGSLGMLLIIWSKYNKIKLNKNCRCFFIIIFLITFYNCFKNCALKVLWMHFRKITVNFKNNEMFCKFGNRNLKKYGMKWRNLPVIKDHGHKILKL